MEKTTIPEKLYVTVQYRGDTNNQDGLLGFASPYTKDAAFEKRKHTQDTWAYGAGITVDIDSNDDITVTGTGTSYYNGNKTWDAGMLFMANCYPKILANDPTEGFQLAKSVRRHGWGGGGNVVWRITDPRGFDLEISSENFASILNCSTVEKGVIIGKCIWGRNGSKNVLLPEASELYQRAMSMTKKVNSKISLKDIKPGDTVELLNNNILKEDLVCKYLGRYYFLCAKVEAGNIGIWHLAPDQQQKYLFQNPRTGKYFIVGSPRVIDIVERSTIELDQHQVAKTLSAALLDASSNIDFGYGMMVGLVSDKRLDLKQVTSSFELIENFNYAGVDSIPYLNENRYRRCNYAIKMANQFKIIRVTSPGEKINTCKFTLDNNVITFDTTLSSHASWYGSHRQYRHWNWLEDCDLTGKDFYHLVIKYQDLVGGHITFNV